MKVKGTGSRCLLEECVKANYYARFHPHSYHCCKEMKFIPRLDANCGQTDGRTNGGGGGGGGGGRGGGGGVWWGGRGGGGSEWM